MQMREGPSPSALLQLRLPPNQQALDVETETCAIQWLPHLPLLVSSSPSPSASSLYSLALPLSVCSVSVHPSSGYSPHQRHLISYMEYDLRVTLVSQGALGRPCLPQPLRCTMPWVLGARRVRQAGPWWLSCAEGSRGRKLQ